ncbi:NAD(P)/FAD-dependent oxidoreductase [Sandaracinus amylolyticus]|uniref:NAD(P)/FAD-dependent oxidoreductase n=1 Tax=Sandaracinus amylolyticus TaxID=927083 RepID=UPI001F26CD06|nr:NAD(P)/FAD-dependent oxidoreductase [Sandaracinus amylolyticus]UJR78355.1 Flavoprotein monooxygenase [Sandaracinus amylolyticus]
MAETIDANVVILGAGPAGTAAAAHLGTLGVRNVVLVDKHDFPRDKTCGSGVSPKGIETLKQLGVWHEVEPHGYWIKGIRLVTPGGYDSTQSAGDVGAAIVCQRRVLDHVLLKKAVSRGTRFVPDFHVTEALEENGRVVGVRAADGREVRAKYTLVAGGSHCRVGLPEQRPRKVIQAIMGWWDDVPFKAHHVEMVFDRMVEPYYGWLFPEGERRVNIGITYEDGENGEKKNARQLFTEFLDKHYRERLKGATQIGGWKGHPVVWSFDIEKLTAPGRVVIGEAGLMTHPATAEGIYQGMRSGMLGAEAVADVLNGRLSEKDAMRDYERACRATFQLSFWGGGVFRKIVRTDALDWMVKLGDTPMVQSAAARLMAQM